LREMLENSDLPKTCWICGGEAGSGEHKTKRSDLAAIFREPSPATPLRLHTASRKNQRIASFNSDKLKFPDRICHFCNTARTQPYDRAWQQMSSWLWLRAPSLRPGAIVRANRIFPHDTGRKMRDVQLYFCKLFGCLILEGGVPIDTASFSKAIMSGSFHPDLYLKFTLDNPGTALAGRTDLHLQLTPEGECLCAVWVYYVGSIGVMVMLARDGHAMRERMKGAWHPRFGTNQLPLHSLDD
jgi:hypothetical protein